jgi:hypothetical protein
MTTTKTTMRQTTGDLWQLPGDARCITTNGTLKKDGRGVMGRGVARQATERYRGLPGILGKHLVRWGNHVGVLIEQGETASMPLIAVPVKHEWHEMARLELIKQSMRELVALTDDRGWGTVILPRPGCGNGGLKWEYVEQVIAPILDARFVVVYQGTGPRWQL